MPDVFIGTPTPQNEAQRTAKRPHRHGCGRWDWAEKVRNPAPKPVHTSLEPATLSDIALTIAASSWISVAELVGIVAAIFAFGLAVGGLL
jgi:hypothetical protein